MTRLQCESLEAREVCSVSPTMVLDGHTLRVTGTNGHDTIRISYDPGAPGFVSPATAYMTWTVNGREYGKKLTMPSCDWVEKVVFEGGDGNDFFSFGSPLATWIDIEARGGAGDDVLFGGGGDDKLYGGADNDTLYGRDGNDYLYGESGDDLLSDEYRQNDKSLFVIDLGPLGGDDFGSGFNFLFGGSGTDTVVGGIGTDRLDGGQDGCWDKLYGKGGSDTFVREDVKLGQYLITWNIDSPMDFDSNDKTVPGGFHLVAL